MGELFDAAETVGHGVLPRKERLGIMTNGGGVGIIATDLLIDEGGELAALQPRTIAALDKHMPRIWSRANPVDIVGDADGARYAAALDILADDRSVGAVLAMNVPTALSSPEDAARAIAGAAGRRVVPVIGCWIGGPHAATRIGFPVALKLLSREITHKSDVGGVALDLGSEQEVREAAGAMHDKVCTAAPGARIDGFVVQPMVKRPHAIELILGAAEDPVFGPILMVGHGGVAAEVIDDKALALPPLDPVLAEAALSRTRVDRLLRGYRDREPAARGAVGEAMVPLSQLVADVDEIAELDINPLLVDAAGVIALDARIVARQPVARQERAARPALRPPPRELPAPVHRAA